MIALGHSKKKPIPKLKRAHHWNPRVAPPPQGPGGYDLNVHGLGQPEVWDRKRGTFAPSNIWTDGGFIIPNLNIDHMARLKFCVKTLIGIGWKLFTTNLLSVFDMQFLRRVLSRQGPSVIYRGTGGWNCLYR